MPLSADGPEAESFSLKPVKESKEYNFPTEEEEVLRFWTDIDAFKEQLRRTEGKPEYSFYDGPPFATGLPHYGHLLAGTLKARAAACAATAALRHRRAIARPAVIALVLTFSPTLPSTIFCNCYRTL